MRYRVRAWSSLSACSARAEHRHPRAPHLPRSREQAARRWVCSAHSLIPHPGRLMQGITLPGLRERRHLGPVEARGAALEEPEDGVEKFHLALMLRHHREQSVVVLCGRVRHRLRAALSFVAGSSHVTRARMQFDANAAMLAPRVKTPSTQRRTEEKVLGKRIGYTEGDLRPIRPFSFSSRKVKGVEEGGKGGWGGITSLGRIERCCLVRRTDDGTCAALQTLVQHVQHIRGSNRVAHHQWCRLNRFACPDWLCACVRRKEVIARKRLERAQDKDGASGFLFRQTPSVARRGCKLCPV